MYFGDQDWDSLLGLIHAWKSRVPPLMSSKGLRSSPLLPEHLTTGQSSLYLHILQQPCPLLAPLALFLLHVQAELSQSATDFSHFQSTAVQLSYGAVPGSRCAGQLLPKKGGFLLA